MENIKLALILQQRGGRFCMLQRFILFIMIYKFDRLESSTTHRDILYRERERECCVSVLDFQVFYVHVCIVLTLMKIYYADHIIIKSVMEKRENL